jgi:flavorubredoxin
MLSRIASVIEPSQIDFIVSNHAEMDHSGSIPEVMNIIKPEAILTSMMGEKALNEHFHRDLPLKAVKDGEILDFGDYHLHFAETRMLHWPDSQFAYLPEQKLLFSQDGFGMHLASTERFDDELPEGFLTAEAGKYYANILLPYSPVVQKVLTKVGGLNWDIKTILPDHGPIWRKNPDKIIALYQKWSSGTKTNKVLIIYDTMWGSTAKMASAIAEGVKEGGASPMMLTKGTHRSDVATHLLEAGAIIVGSPTLNNNLLPTIAEVMTYLKGLKPTGLIGAAFGSYGWNSRAVEDIETYLREMKVELVAPGLKVKYVPEENALKSCYDLGKIVAEKLSERVSK